MNEVGSWKLEDGSWKQEERSLETALSFLT